MHKSYLKLYNNVKKWRKKTKQILQEACKQMTETNTSESQCTYDIVVRFTCDKIGCILGQN